MSLCQWLSSDSPSRIRHIERKPNRSILRGRQRHARTRSIRFYDAERAFIHSFMAEDPRLPLTRALMQALADASHGMVTASTKRVPVDLNGPATKSGGHGAVRLSDPPSGEEVQGDATMLSVPLTLLPMYAQDQWHTGRVSNSPCGTMTPAQCTKAL